MQKRFKPLVNRGESAVLKIAEQVCEATGTKPFAKIRIADAIRIEGSGISDVLYRYRERSRSHRLARSFHEGVERAICWPRLS
jgi:hypothetical protein